MKKKLDNIKMWESLRRIVDNPFARDIELALVDQGFKWDGEHIVPLEENKGNLGGISPKFKVGDWVVWDNKIICYVGNIYQGKESLMYTITDTNNMTRSYSVKGFDNNARFWTIQDAKNGDVLEFCDHGRLVVGIVSFISKRTGKVDVYCLLEANNFKVGIYYALDTINPHPVTKELCDILYAKMKEVGYEWDAEKKELKKLVEPKQYPCDNCKLRTNICKSNCSEYKEYLLGKKTSDKELTEFEAKVKELMEIVSAYGKPDLIDNQDVKSRALRLLDIARKQIIEELKEYEKNAPVSMLPDGWIVGVRDCINELEEREQYKNWGDMSEEDKADFFKSEPFKIKKDE